MLGFILAPVVVALAALITLQRAERAERPLLMGGLAAHIVGSVALVVYHEYVYGGGDMLTYRDIGLDLAHLVETDARWAVDILKLLLHRDNDLPLDFFQNSSSGTMCALMTIFIYSLGDNLYLICIIVSMFAYVGQVATYRAAASKLYANERIPALSVLMLLPSVVFWSSGFIKEAFVIGFLGITCFAASELAARRSFIAPAFLLPFGLIGIALTKAYVLFPLVLAIGGWLYAARPDRRIGVGYQLLGLLVAVLGLVGVSALFPDFGVGQLGANIAHQQRAYTTIEAGGSNIEIGDVDEEPEGEVSLAQQLKFFPLALVNSLARPFLVEARSVTTLIAGIEMTLVVVLVFAVIRRAKLRTVVREIRRRPPLMFAVVFVLSFNVAVGLATRNLGTLSRYRAPALPLYVGFLAVLRVRFAKHTRQAEKALVLPGRSASLAERYLAERRAAVRARATPSPK